MKNIYIVLIFLVTLTITSCTGNFLCDITGNCVKKDDNNEEPPATEPQDKITNVTLTKYFFNVEDNPKLNRSYFGIIDNDKKTITITIETSKLYNYGDGLIPTIVGVYTHIYPAPKSPLNFWSNRDIHYELKNTNGEITQYKLTIQENEDIVIDRGSNIFNNNTDLIFLQDTSGKQYNVSGIFDLELDNQNINLLLRKADIEYFNKNRQILFTFTLKGLTGDFKTPTLTTSIPAVHNIVTLTNKYYDIYINFKEMKELRIEKIEMIGTKDFSNSQKLQYVFTHSTNGKSLTKDTIHQNNTTIDGTSVNYTLTGTDSVIITNNLVKGKSVTPYYNNITGTIKAPYVIKPKFIITFTDPIIQLGQLEGNNYVLSTYADKYNIELSSELNSITLTPKYADNEYQSPIPKMIKIFIGNAFEDFKEYNIDLIDPAEYWGTAVEISNIAQINLANLHLVQFPDIFKVDMTGEHINYNLIYQNLTPMNTPIYNIDNFYTVTEYSNLQTEGKIKNQSTIQLVDFFNKRNNGDLIHSYSQEFNADYSDNGTLTITNAITNGTIVTSNQITCPDKTLTFIFGATLTATFNCLSNNRILDKIDISITNNLASINILEHYIFFNNNLNFIANPTATTTINHNFQNCRNFEISTDTRIIGMRDYNSRGCANLTITQYTTQLYTNTITYNATPTNNTIQHNILMQIPNNKTTPGTIYHNIKFYAYNEIK